MGIDKVDLKLDGGAPEDTKLDLLLVTAGLGFGGAGGAEEETVGA